MIRRIGGVTAKACGKFSAKASPIFMPRSFFIPRRRKNKNQVKSGSAFKIGTCNGNNASIRWPPKKRFRNGLLPIVAPDYFSTRYFSTLKSSLLKHPRSEERRVGKE